MYVHVLCVGEKERERERERKRVRPFFLSPVAWTGLGWTVGQSRAGRKEESSRSVRQAASQPASPAPRAQRLARYEVGIDSYRAAKILVDKHGTEAKAFAGRRMQELLEAGDEAGAAAWADITFAVQEMTRWPAPGEARN